MKNISFLKVVLLVIIAIIAVVSTSAFVTSQRTPASSQRTAASSDFKVRYKTTMAGGGGQGMSGESVTMIKGARERSENHTGMGYDTISITQCDLKRTILISDTARKYTITPMESSSPAGSPTPSSPPPAVNTPTTQGGLVEYITSTIDTGERKEMFGFTARHVKGSTTINAAPDSCSPGKRRIERDGWYIDLNVGFTCDRNAPQAMPSARPQAGGCRDQVKMRSEGKGEFGYPLIETIRMSGDNGTVMFSQTREVIELSRATLDMALFDIPAGYTQAADSSELYAMPSMASMGEMNPGQPGVQPGQGTAAANQPKQPGALVIGVVQFNNKSSRSLSLDLVRQRLIGQIQGAGFSAIAMNATSQMEAEVEAKVKQVDFILYTDIATLKMNKLGGLLGGLSGGSAMPKTESKLEFKLFAVGEPSPRLQSNTSAKEEGDENSVGTAVDAEARMVVAEVRKRGRG